MNSLGHDAYSSHDPGAVAFRFEGQPVQLHRRVEELSVLGLWGIPVDVEQQVLVSEVRRLKGRSRVHMDQSTASDVLPLGWVAQIHRQCSL